MPPHGEGALLGLVVVALGGLVVGCTCAWLRRDVDGDVSPLVARARRGPDGGHIGSNTDRLVAAQRKRARRAERNLQIAGRRSSRHLETGQPPTARWWRRTASRRR